MHYQRRKLSTSNIFSQQLIYAKIRKMLIMCRKIVKVLIFLVNRCQGARELAYFPMRTKRHFFWLNQFASVLPLNVYYHRWFQIRNNSLYDELKKLVDRHLLEWQHRVMLYWTICLLFWASLKRDDRFLLMWAIYII